MIQIVVVGVIADPLEYPGASSTEAVEEKLLGKFGRGILLRKLNDGNFIGVLSETLEAGEYQYRVTAQAGFGAPPPLAISNTRSEFCQSSQEALREDGFGVTKGCPICLKQGIFCEVGCHPPTASAKQTVNTLIHVPADIRFSVGVLDSQRAVTPHQACSHETLIDLEDALNGAEEAVDRGLLGDERVAPLVFARMARGGKTTFLCELFDRLKTAGKAVTMISLLNLACREDETGGDVLARLISLQLLQSLKPSAAANIKVDEDALFEFIDASRGGRPWVLLVDELNNLGVPVDADASKLLRRILDRRGCFVVFTSHVPMTVSAGASARAKTYVPASDRAVITVPLPLSTDISLLDRMFSNREPRLQVTPSEVSMHLGIPSLIYATKREKDPPSACFERQRITVEKTEAKAVLQSFVNEVLTGDQDPGQRSVRFYLFGQMPQEMCIQWPICYIACILDMPAFNLSLDMQGTVNRLAAQAERTESGLDWELVVQVAVVLQSLNAKVNRRKGPFDIADDEECKFVVVRELPAHVITIDGANAYIESVMTECQPGTILVATPKYASFPDYDLIVAYKRQNGTTRKFGVQVKLGRAYPKREAAECLEAGILVRGWAPTANNVKGKWKYWDEQKVKALVGSSLVPLIPKTWPAVPTVDEYD